NLRRVVELTIDRSDWTKSTATILTTSGTLPPARETGWAYDSVSQVIGGGIGGGVFYAFDPAARVWTSKTMQVQSTGGAKPGYQVFHAMDYDPVDGVFIFIATEASDTSLPNYYSSMHTWAYRFGASAPTPPPPPPGTNPPTISGVTASNVSSTGATVVWATNNSADSQIDYGPTAAYGNQTTLNPSPVTSHSQTISGLVASTTYNYRVKSRDATGNLATSPNFTFTTLPVTPPPPPPSPITDPTVVIAEPTLNLPAPGVTYNDPAFGTATVRIADPTAQGLMQMNPLYSQLQAWNADMRFLLVFVGDGYRILDPNTFAVLHTIDFGWPAYGEGLRWSPTDPLTLYYTGGLLS